MNSYLLPINYRFDTEALLREANQKEFAVYEDTKHGKTDGWNILKDDIPQGLIQAKEFCEFYGLEEGSPRYYKLEANHYLMPHVDFNTTCSVNHILSNESAPVTILGEDYHYKTALLNTSVQHGVNNIGKEERLLFKISFFESTYEEIREKIRSREAAFSIA